MSLTCKPLLAMKLLTALALLTVLSGCGLISTQAVYEEIRAQENAKAVGSDNAARKPLPSYDAYKKERSGLSPESPSISTRRPP